MKEKQKTTNLFVAFFHKGFYVVGRGIGQVDRVLVFQDHFDDMMNRKYVFDYYTLFIRGFRTHR
jgi:hypothetical protein